MPTYDVIAYKQVLTRFTVTCDKETKVEDTIDEKIQSDKELIWTDDDKGIGVIYASGNSIPKRPRTRFFLKDDHLLEDTHDAPHSDGE